MFYKQVTVATRPENTCFTKRERWLQGQNKQVLQTENSGYRARISMFYKQGTVATGPE